MKSSAKNIVLKSVDDIFQTEENRADAQRERVQEIPLDQLKPFKNHPFKVRDDQRMLDTVDSIREYGVLVPAIARPDPEGGYELISGHRRKRGCEMAGLQTMPVIIRELDDDAAVLVMVDSNIQREELLPSERAFAYKMKLEALKHQGARSDLTSMQVAQKLSVQKVGDDAGVSKDQVRRFIRLTELISELLDMVDERKLAFNPAVEVSYLKQDEQRMLLEAMDAEQTTPSLSQAQRLKKFSQEGRLTEEAMSAIMSEEKKSEMDKVTLRSDTLHKYFPKSYTPKQMEQTIIRLLDVEAAAEKSGTMTERRLTMGSARLEFTNGMEGFHVGIFRVEKVKDYTTISNYHLRDKNLSLKAKGLLTLILALPEDWNFTIRGLSAICKEGVESIGTALKRAGKGRLSGAQTCARRGRTHE